ncbi:histidine triad nucleotide-binding protein 3 isoform X1 [Cucumis melo var. makuwa]|uniref:Histidine triad nucleotide-binding protein 3 isoform X1 n=1 Tax=Cucumis melo var. makuwa TaxID=1194695 RepID=A0A5A7T9M5_CUCMM|nr:histidine triad nucleotide-binding protein 3 isoform X1 [Cucumis melo var. makuwa]
MAATTISSCIFCQKASNSTANNLLHFDERVVAFEDINPSAVSFFRGNSSTFVYPFRSQWPSMTFVSCHLEGAEDGLYKATTWHFLVIPKEHIPTVRNLQRRAEDYSLGNVTVVKCNSFMVFCLKKRTGGGNGVGEQVLKTQEI